MRAATSKSAPPPGRLRYKSREPISARPTAAKSRSKAHSWRLRERRGPSIRFGSRVTIARIRLDHRPDRADTLLELPRRIRRDHGTREPRAILRDHGQYPADRRRHRHRRGPRLRATRPISPVIAYSGEPASHSVSAFQSTQTDANWPPSESGRLHRQVRYDQVGCRVAYLFDLHRWCWRCQPGRRRAGNGDLPFGIAVDASGGALHRRARPTRAIFRRPARAERFGKTKDRRPRM